uniref:ATP synthase subunit a n=1 Tax=Cuspidaria undata TaxID=2952366 RepID=A0AAT9T5Y0_9BIVA|nr:ATP synthase F0 subunit 6 [Cuspidaria undata]USF19204.1 ATP synthase F0 subunit 6 [Cuspidaria undata]
MMTDLFSSFDDVNFCMWGSFFNFLVLLCPGLMVMSLSYFFVSRYYFFLLNLDMISMKSFLSGVELLIPALFLFLLSSNINGLIPFSFSWTSHFVVTYGLAIPFWFSVIVSSISWNWSLVVSGLLPYGVTGLLAILMVWVEIVSNLARPLFLGMRLTVNMMVGQVILGLSGSILGSLLMSGAISSSLLVLGVVVLVVILEIGVAIIQAYLFCFLLLVYIDEYSV